MTLSKNDIAWERLFEQYRISEQVQATGHCLITAADINHYREARLMTKFDHRSQLPRLFHEQQLSILPVSRGGYVIGQFETFCDFDREAVDVVRMQLPSFLSSLDYPDITSEAMALNCAFVSRILHDFTGTESLYPTVSGRMRSSAFTFCIDTVRGAFPVKVANAQVEIDGGYEGAEALYLIEAKNYLSDDFMIRQLYYPFRLWQGRMPLKAVRPLFLTYTNGIFHLREYTFGSAEHYNSIRLIRQKKYVLQEDTLNRSQVRDILLHTPVVEEPAIPFPQADSFDRIINLCELLQQNEALTKERITRSYDFDARQTDYYLNACKYLGLVERGSENGQAVWRLSREGKQVFLLSLPRRQQAFIRLIVSHGAFRQALTFYLDKGYLPPRETIVAFMKECTLYKVTADTTYFRRASTILGWISWIWNQMEAGGNKNAF